MRALRAALALLLAASTAFAAPGVAPVPLRVPRLGGAGAAAGASPALTLGLGGSPVPALTASGLSLSLPASLSPLPAAGAPLFAPQAAPPALSAAPPALPASLLSAPAAAPVAPFAPPPASVLPAPGEGPQAKPRVFHSLQEFASHVLSGRAGIAADRVYEGAGLRPDAPEVDAAGERPSIPAGVRAVEIHEVRGPRDIDAWIPSGPNSDALRAGLRKSLGRMLPFDIRVYRDAAGGSFAAVDLSRNPGNVDRHPEVAPHEAALIKKIQLYTSDLQILVREDGKTPDLVVEGTVTELKSLFGKGDLGVTLAAANEQVLRHAQRHGLGYGAVAVDMMGRESVPVEAVRRKLDDFAASTKQDVGIARAYFFAGSELKVFQRGEDGRFRLDASPRPFGPRTRSRPARAVEVHEVQLHTKAGRLEGARSRLARLEAHAEHDPRLAEAREQLEAERVLRKISKYVGHGREREAHALWDRFRASASPAVVHQLAEKVHEALKVTLIPDMVARAEVPDLEVIVREITEPARRLKDSGVRATVTVYGSARTYTPEEAARRLRAAEAAASRGEPGSERALAEAREDHFNSKYYELARRFGALIAEKGRGLVAVVTGGGPGIMEAANRGAHERGGPSVGYNIILEHEQSANPYITRGLGFEFQNFATRKMALRHGAMALTYLPGGFGTMDELYEVLTLMQTGKIPRVPIVLLGDRSYWEPRVDLDTLIRMRYISPGDRSLIVFAENEREAWAAIETGVAGIE